MPVFQPVRPVQVSVTAEHLLVHILDFSLESIAETRGLAEPMAWIRACLCRCWKWWRLLERLSGKGAFVLNLARDPRLDVLHVCRCREVNWVPACVNPRVGRADTLSAHHVCNLNVDQIYSRASRHGRTRLIVAQTDALATVFGLHNLDHARKKAILLDD